ncbi:MAG TPA: hypothetical protein VFA89_11440 [Terriglobales bacterium]|nr:hypothetical protein [Terriglobales bacterium]
MTDEEIRATVEALGRRMEQERTASQPIAEPPVDADVASYLESAVAAVEFRPSCECGCGLPAPVPERPSRPRRYVHGHFRRCHTTPGWGTPEWRAYHHAKTRCTNPRTKDWQGYGGRGIKFLFVSFEQFYRLLGPRPGPEYSLDRIRVEGNYEPGNCRWSTPVEQANNRRPRKTLDEELLEIPE